MKKMLDFLDRHFEAIFVAYLWMNGSVLAALVGRPWLGAVGLVTVLPFLLLYARGVRSKGNGLPPVH